MAARILALATYPGSMCIELSFVTIGRSAARHRGAQKPRTTRKRTGGRKAGQAQTRSGSSSGKCNGNGTDVNGRASPSVGSAHTPGPIPHHNVTGRSSGSPSSSSANLPVCEHTVAWSRFVRLTAAGAAPEWSGRACSRRHRTSRFTFPAEAESAPVTAQSLTACSESMQARLTWRSRHRQAIKSRRSG